MSTMQQKSNGTDGTKLTTPKLKLTGLRKSFGAKQVLNGIDLDVGRAESLVVIGGSGTGKSVMLKCAIGLMHPDSGSIQDRWGGDGQSAAARSRARHAEIRHAVSGRRSVR